MADKSVPTFNQYETPELDDLRRRGRYYNLMSYRYFKNGENEKGEFAQSEAKKWWLAFNVKCDAIEGVGSN